MRLEAEKHFPLNLQEAVIAYTLINHSTGNGESVREYQLIAVSKKTSDSMVMLAVEAGFNPVSLEIAPLATLRSINHNEMPHAMDHDTVRINIDCGSECTGLLITRGGDYRFHRNLNIGIKHFLEVIVTVGNTNRSEVHRRLYLKGSLAEKGLLDITNKLISRITQTFDYWFEQEGLTESDLPAVVEICGGGAFIPGLAAHLQKELHMKPFLYNPLRRLNVSLEQQNTTSSQEGALFTVAHGLALLGWLN